MGPVRTPPSAVLAAVEAAAMGLGEGSLAPKVGCLLPSGPGARLLQLPRGVAGSRAGRAAGSKQDLEDWSEALSAAVTALRAGGLVALPTDTLYGVACSACCSAALGAVYSLKGRSQTKPLAVCLGRVADIYRYCQVRVPRELLEDLLPGPVTLVMERSGELSKDLNPFTPLVGIRIPDHAFMRDLAQMFSGPLALTSANISSQPSSLNVKEFQDLWPQLSLVIDGGPIGDVKSPECRLGSTVVDLSVPGKYRIIRPGCALTQTAAILQKKYGLVPSEEPCS
ncbi:yrdC domain-containing protein, mitochondrial [Trichosurus vulpecula]|uniref:yrdC domain-containing protein, mitochondrial n=1 Tax=Trichosurus vulpecula TaxID=9337 RepID=UPI00186B1C46|nr:yrdC domain-containing protein, mitochondrial [Trichosurus vulpecula]